MTDQYVGARDSSTRQELMEFIGHPFAGSGQRTKVAPAESRSIVRTDPRDLREFRLHFCPVDRPAGTHRIQDDRGAAFSGAVEVELVSANVDELPRRLVVRAISRHADELIYHAYQDKCQKSAGDPNQPLHG